MKDWKLLKLVTGLPKATFNLPNLDTLRIQESRVLLSLWFEKTISDNRNKGEKTI
jgi:hypothetical protein